MPKSLMEFRMERNETAKKAEQAEKVAKAKGTIARATNPPKRGRPPAKRAISKAKNTLNANAKIQLKSATKAAKTVKKMRKKKPATSRRGHSTRSEFPPRLAP